ncbi:MAG: YjfI family protein [Dokdonella sp.]
MTRTPTKSPSATARSQRAFRERMREKGLVPRQVFIRPQHREILATFELALREPVLPDRYRPLEAYSAMTQPWTTTALHEALAEHVEREKLPFQLTLERGSDPTIAISLPEHGDLVIHLMASGEQLFASTPLCLGSQVEDRAAFNDACLRLNPLNPLSNIGLQHFDGEDVYVVFGELSTRSPLANIVEEIDVLARNTLQAAEALRSYMSQNGGHP